MIDKGLEQTSSKVAAGIINPVTGRRVVKSWMIDELIPFAKNTYHEIEEKLKQPIYHEINIIRTLPDIEADNLWNTRSALPDLEDYMLTNPSIEGFKEKLQAVFNFGEIQQTARLDIKLLLESYKHYLKNDNKYLGDNFDYDELIKEDNFVRYKGVRAKKIIFCEGYQTIHNPYFSYLPFVLSKGEVLIIKIPGAAFTKIIKHKLFIVPLGKDYYWIGSTYDWKFNDSEPTEAGKENLIQRLKASLQLPYEVIMHKAAIRPTTKDRRPFLGIHPEYPCLAIFNGMGTKGASLSPFFAQHFVDFLCDETDLNPQVDIKRCKKISSND